MSCISLVYLHSQLPYLEANFYVSQSCNWMSLFAFQSNDNIAISEFLLRWPHICSRCQPHDRGPIMNQKGLPNSCVHSSGPCSLNHKYVLPTASALIVFPVFCASPYSSFIPPFAIVCTTCTPCALYSFAKLCASILTPLLPAPYAANCGFDRMAPSVPVKMIVPFFEPPSAKALEP